MDAMASQITSLTRGLLNRLFRCRSKETSKLRVTSLWAGNSPVTGEFPAQMASNAKNVSIWWRHHDFQIVLSWIPRDSIHTQCRSRIYAGLKDCRMVASSHEKAFHITGPLCGESWSVDFSHKTQWLGDLMVSLMYARTNGWINSEVVGDLGCHICHVKSLLWSLHMQKS